MSRAATGAAGHAGRRAEAGYTMVEMLFVILVLASLLATSYSMLWRVRDSTTLATEQAADVDGARKALDVLEKDLRCAESVEVIGTGFLRGRTRGGAWSCRLEGGSLIRNGGAMDRVLARRVAAFRVEREGALVTVVLDFGPRGRGALPPWTAATRVALRAGGGP